MKSLSKWLTWYESGAVAENRNEEPRRGTARTCHGTRLVRSGFRTPTKWVRTAVLTWASDARAQSRGSRAGARTSNQWSGQNGIKSLISSSISRLVTNHHGSEDIQLDVRDKDLSLAQENIFSGGKPLQSLTYNN